MKIYNVYTFTRTADGQQAINYYQTADARRVLRAIRGSIAYKTGINVIVSGKSVAHA